MSDKPLGAQIPQLLASHGVTTIFGIPGVHNQELYRGIREAGLSHVLARHEQGAGFMADGYARASGQPGVAFVITGPGLTNAMTPIGQAYSDSVPLLVISSALPEVNVTKGQLHQMKDQRTAAACVADWSCEARCAPEAYALIDRAFAEFQSKRPRPKHLQVTIPALEGLAAAPAPAKPFELAEAPGDLEALFSTQLRTAKRPLLVFGGGARDADTHGLAARLGAATFVTYAGRGCVEPSYPLDFGASLARPDSAAVVASADLVIVIGSELAEVDLWRAHLGHSAPMIRVDIDADVLNDAHQAEIRVKARAAQAVTALHNAAHAPASGWSEAEVHDARVRWRAETDAERPGVVPVADALRAALPSETMVFSDMTQFAYVAKEIWPLPRAGLWHHPSGFGTLGYALPAAIGGKVAMGDAPVIAIAGDYGFQYTLPELGVAIELGLSLPIILWDNNALAEIRDSMVSAQIAPNAVDLRNPDFGKLAEAYGARYTRPRAKSELAQVMSDALTAKGPTLVHLTSALS